MAEGGRLDMLECLECGRVVAPRVHERLETYQVRGEPIEILARVAVCPSCGADISVEELDDATLRAAFNEYRQRHGLMTSEEMVALRKRYGLGVRPFSLLLGWGEITLHRYESGSLQDAAHEAQLRLADEPANIRILLTANGDKLTTRQRAHLERALEALGAELEGKCAPVAADRFVAREEQDRYGGFAPYSMVKLREMMVFFAGLPDAIQTKLNKLLYFADAAHFREHGVSISGSPYLAMQRGPVPEHYDWIMADLIEDGALDAEEVAFAGGGSGIRLEARRQPDQSVFAAAELVTLQRTARDFGHMTSTMLSELSHAEPAWVETPLRERMSFGDTPSPTR